MILSTHCAVLWKDQIKHTGVLRSKVFDHVHRFLVADIGLHSVDVWVYGLQMRSGGSHRWQSQVVVRGRGDDVGVIRW